jgi:hypothetical protein
LRGKWAWYLRGGGKELPIRERKRSIDASEAELMLQIMSRVPDWAVIVALVGNGQEIHKGEAGLEEWGRALNQRSDEWRIVASPEVLPGGGSSFQLFPEAAGRAAVRAEPRLHLDVSVRSPRAQRISDWVDLVLQGNTEQARSSLSGVRGFPLVLTRDLDEARSWLHDHARNDRRCGLVASSGARRLRAYGLEMSSPFRHGYPYEEWFLADHEDTRSSSQLEVAASQFECQGLELDWVGVCWGGDLTFDEKRHNWRYRRFIGARWQSIRQVVEQTYLLNRYRVLLTRAREGMVIWVPPGKTSDDTLDPALFDQTARLLLRAGVPLLEH